MIKYSVVIPCYNEASNLPLLLERLEQIVVRDDIQVIMVNNGSTDNSREVFDQYCPNYKFVKQVLVTKNRGYGYGLLQGLKAADGEYVGWIHADMQLEPKNMIKAIELFEDNSNPKNLFVKGKRRNRPLSDKIFTFGMSVFETVLFKTRLNDIGAIPVLFHRDMLKNMTNAPFDFSIELYTYYQAKVMKKNIVRLPVELRHREQGKSSWNTGIVSKFKQSMRIIKASFKIKKDIKGKD